ncbi:MAG: hypothetical protein QOD63_2243 [Actinomycetota bacterium]|jgi:hypothetical protein|nr:hypothetical protein [Actinomycetota bacterium]
MAALTLAPENWSCGERAGWLFISILVAAFCQAGFGPAKKVMLSTGGVGIVGFETIGSWSRADPVLEKWWTSGRGWRAARWSLVVDVPFLVAYGFGLWVLAAVVADHARDLGWTGWATAAAATGVGFLAAAAFDLLEDVALLVVLYRKRSVNWPGIARLFAFAKFGLLVVGGLFLATVGIAFLGPHT